jgi:pyruvate kinase
VVGGTLSNNKGIKKRGRGLSASALTDRDKADIAFVADIGVDYLTVSFVCNGDDVRLARELFAEAGGTGGIASKIGRVDEAIAMATMYTANHLGVTSIAALTEIGSTVKWMSRMNSGIPI